MPLLMLMLAGPLLVFLVLVTACVWAMRRETRQEQLRQKAMAERRAWQHAFRCRASSAHRVSWAVPAGAAFDPDSALLWETQVTALQLISAAGRDGLLLSSLRPHYAREARRFPEIYDGSNFEDWLDFLEQSGMAMTREGVVRITHIGRELLLFQEQRHWTRLG